MSKSIEELVDDLVYEEEGASWKEHSRARARAILRGNPRLAEVLSNPAVTEPYGKIPPYGEPDKNEAMEVPLSQDLPANAIMQYERWRITLGTFAVGASNALREHPRAVLLSLYNKRTGKRELAVAGSLLGAVCKLLLFRLREFVKRFKK